MSSLHRRVCHIRRRGERVLGNHRREGILASVVRRRRRGALEGSLGTASAAAVELRQLGKRRRRRRFRETDLHIF